MKACVLTASEKLEVLERPRPSPPRYQVLVRVQAASLCGTDVHQYEGTLPVVFPRVLGHDFAGVVEEVGRDVPGDLVGTRVAIKPSYPCGQCERCAVGDHENCPDKKLIGLWSDGCMAEYVVAPRANVVPIPEGVSTEGAANLEPFAVALNTMRRLQPQIGEWVVVLGCGPIGLAQVSMAAIAGARVIAVDVRDEALQMASRFGAKHIVNAATGDAEQAVSALTDGGGADIVIEAAGAAQTVKQMVQLVRKYGRMASVGIQTTMGGLDLVPVIVKGLTLHGVGGNGGKGQYETCLRLAAEGAIHPEQLVTHRFPFEAAPAAFQLAKSKDDGVIKVVLVADATAPERIS